MESVDYKKGSKDREKSNSTAVFSKSVRAGNRTYFFDVRTTRNNENYLTITESKKIFDENGNFHYQKHKVFLYPEDFMNFQNALEETLTFIAGNQEQKSEPQSDQIVEEPEGLSNKGDDVKENIIYSHDFDTIEEKSFNDLDFDDI